MKRINFATLLLLLALLVLFLFTGKAYQNQALSFHFVDEEENFVSGKYMLKGEKLYSDLFANHQPLSFIFSAGVQKVTQPNSVFLLVKRHREAIIGWSIVWGLLLVLRFRLLGLLTLLVYEPLKIFLLGNLFLSESLVVYPLAYLLFWVFLTKKVLIHELIFVGFCMGLSFFLLSPLWPLIGALAFIVFWKMRQARFRSLNYFWCLGGIMLLIILVVNFISVSDYFFEVFYINLRYFIPTTSSDPLFLTTLKAFTSPIIAITNFQNGNSTLQVMKISSVMLIVNSLILIRRGNYKFPLLAMLLLGLANIRFVSPGEESYSGFHIIPWFMGLIVTTIVSSKLIWESGLGRLWRLGMFGVLGVILIAIIFKESSQTLFQKRDINRDFYVNYSRQVEFGEAVKIMKNSNDTLFVVPDEWLLYWQADIPHASKMVCYYAWMSEVPEIKKLLHEMFSKNPPTYFYCDRCKFGYFGLEEFFPKYERMIKDGKETNLMVLRTKLHNLSQEQKERLKYYGFTKG